MSAWVKIPLLLGLYEACADGRIRRSSSGRVLKPSVSKSGYAKVTVHVGDRQLTPNVHRLVADAFIGPANGFCVNHLDGVKSHNQIANLEYTTLAGNARHASALGLMPTGARNGRHTHPESTPRGEDHWSRRNPECLARGAHNGARTKPESRPRGSSHGMAKIDEAVVTCVLAARAAGDSLSLLASKFGICKSTAHNIVTRKQWRHVQ